MGERLRDVAHYRDEAEHRAETVACAKRANLSPSEYVRECVRAANRAMPAPSPTRDELTRAELTAVNLASSALLRATEATNRQGQLLNQLMPKWHRLGERIVWPELAEAVASNGAGGQRAAGGDRRGRRRAVGGDAAATAVIWQAEKLGSHTGGLVRYLLGREAVGEMAHVNQRVVDGYWDDLDSKTVRELAELLDAEVRESGKPADTCTTSSGRPAAQRTATRSSRCPTRRPPR